MPLDPNELERLKIDRTAQNVRTPGGRGLWLWIVGLLSLAGLAWFGFGYLRVGRSETSVRTTLVREEGTSVGSAHTVLNASGYVTPRREATVSSKMTGKVVEVLVEEGKRVEANQILARLDASNLLTNKKLAEAQLASARSALNETEAVLKEARSAFERAKALIAERISSPADLDRAEASFKTAQARFERQQFEISVAERGLDVWEQQLEDTIIRAPFAGIVTAKNAQPGETISPMSAGGFTRTGICTLVDMESLEVEVDVNESFIGRVTPGQEVQSILDAYSDWKIPSKVIAIIPTADRQKATVKVRVGFNQLDPRILPQMGVKVAFQSADAKIATGPVETAPKRVVLRRALQESNGHTYVWLVKPNGLERRAIQVVASVGEEAQVLAGLSAGDRVVLDPPMNLVEGMSVKEAR